MCPLLHCTLRRCPRRRSKDSHVQTCATTCTTCLRAHIRIQTAAPSLPPHRLPHRRHPPPHRHHPPLLAAPPHRHRTATAAAAAAAASGQDGRGHRLQVPDAPRVRVGDLALLRQPAARARARHTLPPGAARRRRRSKEPSLRLQALGRRQGSWGALACMQRSRRTVSSPLTHTHSLSKHTHTHTHTLCCRAGRAE